MIVSNKGTISAAAVRKPLKQPRKEREVVLPGVKSKASGLVAIPLPLSYVQHPPPRLIDGNGQEHVLN